MFDAKFYQAVLPESVQQHCSATPEHVPVVELHLPDGTTLDVCHIETLADTWFAVVYFRNLMAGDDVDRAFLPYPLVQWITVSAHPPHVRRIGFDVARSAAATVILPPPIVPPIIPPVVPPTAPVA